MPTPQRNNGRFKEDGEELLASVGKRVLQVVADNAMLDVMNENRKLMERNNELEETLTKLCSFRFNDGTAEYSSGDLRGVRVENYSPPLLNHRKISMDSLTNCVLEVFGEIHHMDHYRWHTRFVSSGDEGHMELCYYITDHFNVGRCTLAKVTCKVTAGSESLKDIATQLWEEGDDISPFLDHFVAEYPTAVAAIVSVCFRRCHPKIVNLKSNLN